MSTSPITSASITVLATLELKPTGTGTRLVMTEQGAFLDDAGAAANRRRDYGISYLYLSVLINASKSALIVSASVVGMPCGVADAVILLTIHNHMVMV